MSRRRFAWVDEAEQAREKAHSEGRREDLKEGR